jgi:hypothetical protein
MQPRLDLALSLGERVPGAEQAFQIAEMLFDLERRLQHRGVAIARLNERRRAAPIRKQLALIARLPPIMANHLRDDGRRVPIVMGRQGRRKLS